MTNKIKHATSFEALWNTIKDSTMEIGITGRKAVTKDLNTGKVNNSISLNQILKQMKKICSQPQKGTFDQTNYDYLICKVKTLHYEGNDKLGKSFLQRMWVAVTRIKNRFNDLKKDIVSNDSQAGINKLRESLMKLASTVEQKGTQTTISENKKRLSNNPKKSSSFAPNEPTPVRDHQTAILTTEKEIDLAEVAENEDQQTPQTLVIPDALLQENIDQLAEHESDQIDSTPSDDDHESPAFEAQSEDNLSRVNVDETPVQDVTKPDSQLPENVDLLVEPKSYSLDPWPVDNHLESSVLEAQPKDNQPRVRADETPASLLIPEKPMTSKDSLLATKPVAHLIIPPAKKLTKRQQENAIQAKALKKLARTPEQIVDDFKKSINALQLEIDYKGTSENQKKIKTFLRDRLIDRMEEVAKRIKK